MSRPDPLPSPEYFTASDGTRLAYRELGAGRPVLLVHGFFSSGTANWIGNGHAAALVAAGHRVVVPDLRGHGRSATPTDLAAYPPDVLVDDLVVLLDHLGLAGDDDLAAAGYSLGARTVARLLLRGVPVRRAVLGGQGLGALTHVAGSARTSVARHVLSDAAGGDRTPVQRWFAQQWRRKDEATRAALRALLASSVSTPADELRTITVPTLVLTGSDDDVADARDLATTLPRAAVVEVPGDHVTAAGRPEVADALVNFLDGDGGPR
ncbi:Lysophospholipase, alpha-beta hydrolase superfamily [Jatrophihabitans endophyticus]|uniref:Lysophospholipase, alpha-beta hydrolase superfamily n=1 Tax=Jatrophihabitans endophyticus TaxID=1206085 RepID=A0A1M5T5L7_9ACTN|nr:alpha/beta fold hydrolase [Jatrophihabitans endophyticus]SHH45996.1 Lysophospholipase, alpha-beta hydrolase superfamily [Jatrophihabitans endophyticus]